MVYIIHTIQNTGLRCCGIALSVGFLAALNPQANAVHGDDLLTCTPSGTTMDWSNDERLGELVSSLRGLVHEGINPDVYPLAELAAAQHHLELWGSLSDCEN